MHRAHQVDEKWFIIGGQRNDTDRFADVFIFEDFQRNYLKAKLTKVGLEQVSGDLPPNGISRFGSAVVDKKIWVLDED